eukprot:2547190-Rhodomonas_salina.1
MCVEPLQRSVRQHGVSNLGCIEHPVPDLDVDYDPDWIATTSTTLVAWTRRTDAHHLKHRISAVTVDGEIRSIAHNREVVPLAGGDAMEIRLVFSQITCPSRMAIWTHPQLAIPVNKLEVGGTDEGRRCHVRIIRIPHGKDGPIGSTFVEIPESVGGTGGPITGRCRD